MPTEATEVSGPPELEVQHGPALVGAVLGGVLTSAQGRMNGELSRAMGQPIEAALWSFGSGLAVLTCLLAFPRVRAGLGRVRAGVRDGRLRWSQCIGGLAGGLFVACQTFAVPLVGVALFTVASIAGQTGNALAVDRLGIGPGGRKPVHLDRVGAALLAIVGVAVAVSGRLGGAEFSLLPIVLAVLVGGGVAIQQGTNARVNIESRHVLSTTFLNFLTGTTLLVVIALGELAAGTFHPVALPAAPWWAWFGGVAGIGFIAISAWGVRHLGVLVFGLALLTGQLGSALALDLLDPRTRDAVGPAMWLGVAITFVAAALAGWAARARRISAT